LVWPGSQPPDRSMALLQGGCSAWQPAARLIRLSGAEFGRSLLHILPCMTLAHPQHRKMQPNGFECDWTLGSLERIVARER